MAGRDISRDELLHELRAEHVHAQAEHALFEEIYGETTDELMRWLAERRLDALEDRMLRLERAAESVR